MKQVIFRQPMLAAAALGALLAFAGSPATAGAQHIGHRGARSVAVRYDDLDLSRDEGVKALYARLRSAARTVCGDGSFLDLPARAASRRCYDTALANAVASANNTRLAALHEARDRARKGSPRIAAVTPGT